jgi:hypothetical protein
LARQEQLECPRDGEGIVAPTDARRLTADAEAEERLFLNCDATRYAQEGSWRQALDAWEAMRDRLPGDFVELNIAICRYRLGAGAEIAAAALELAQRLSPQPSGQALLLAMLSLHRSGRFEAAALVAAAMGKQGKHPWDLPCLPTMVGTTFAIEDSSGSEIARVLASLLDGCQEGGEERLLIQNLLTSYHAREAAMLSARARGGRKGWVQRLISLFGGGD